VNAPSTSLQITGYTCTGFATSDLSYTVRSDFDDCRIHCDGITGCAGFSWYPTNSGNNCKCLDADCFTQAYTITSTGDLYKFISGSSCVNP
jgi:hypothetical protein